MPNLSGQYLGRYHILEQLGEGGMAVVYKAYDTRLEREVAVKIIRSGAFPSDSLGEVLKRFEREAKSLARLSHPNVVKVHDFGEHEGSPFLVLEYLPGGTLKHRLVKPLPWQDAIRLLLPITRGMAYAHQRGVLHRDIKPANILITESGEPMLSDFGIAKIFEGEQTTALTGSGMAIGTPEYMAPEQWTGKTSPQSDLYSLGIVLYEMITGRKPYLADTPAAILLKQATEPLPNPRQFTPGLPESVEFLLIKLLARDPENRYPDANALIVAMENLLSGIPFALPIAPQAKLDETRKEVLPPLAPSTPTQVEMKDGGKTILPDEVRDETVPAVQQVAEVHKQISPQVPSPSSPRFPRMEIVAIIGLIGILSVALISILSWGKWFPASPGPTPAATNTAPAPTFTPALPTHTFTPALPTRTLEPSLTPTESFTPTATPLPVEITDPKGVTMRLVPAGEFTMGRDDAGASGRVHMVYLDSYYMDVYEVTIKLYKICATAGICSIPKDTSRYNSSSYGNRPVDYVNWDQAKTYCQWRGARLPTEAEWEKAARGTDGRVYPWGAGIDCDKASYRGCVGNTTAVGSHPDGISPYGMYDMAGNVSEWVADWYGDDYYVILGDNASNPQGPSDGYYRGLRGGGWANYDYNVRSDTRYFVEPSYSNSGVGFRCAGTMP